MRNTLQLIIDWVNKDQMTNHKMEHWFTLCYHCEPDGLSSWQHLITTIFVFIKSEDSSLYLDHGRSTALGSENTVNITCVTKYDKICRSMSTFVLICCFTDPLNLCKRELRCFSGYLCVFYNNVVFVPCNGSWFYEWEQYWSYFYYPV